MIKRETGHHEMCASGCTCPLMVWRSLEPTLPPDVAEMVRDMRSALEGLDELEKRWKTLPIHDQQTAILYKGARTAIREARNHATETLTKHQATLAKWLPEMNE